MFCVMIQVSKAEEASSASARCAVFGSARHAGCWPRDRHDRRRTSGSFTYVWKVDICWAPGFRVHTPCGPRKSGIPESVEIPAPVRTVTFRTPRAHAGAAPAPAAFSADGSTCPTLRSSVSGLPCANSAAPGIGSATNPIGSCLVPQAGLELWFIIAIHLLHEQD